MISGEVAAAWLQVQVDALASSSPADDAEHHAQQALEWLSDDADHGGLSFRSVAQTLGINRHRLRSDLESIASARRKAAAGQINWLPD